MRHGYDRGAEQVILTPALGRSISAQPRAYADEIVSRLAILAVLAPSSSPPTGMCCTTQRVAFHDSHRVCYSRGSARIPALVGRREAGEGHRGSRTPRVA